MNPNHKADTLSSILFATDFSENANTAMRWATTIAKAHNASLFMLHVAPVASMGSLPMTIQKEITRTLESLEAIIRDDGVEVMSRWQTGRPWEVISSEAEEHDLVVIGARGHTPLAHLLVGSTADRVLRTSPAPVVTVPHEARRFDRMPQNVVVPTDFSESASLALDAVMRLFGPPAGERLKITLLHAWQPLVEYGDVYAAFPPPNPYVGSEQQAEELLERLAAKIRAGCKSVTPVIRPGYPAKVITEETEAIDADLVAMGTRGHSGLMHFMLGSVAERVMHRVHCPILTVGLASVDRGERTAAEQTAEAAG